MEIEEAIAMAKKWNMTLSQIGFMLYREEDKEYPLRINELEKSDLFARKLVSKEGVSPEWQKIKGEHRPLKTIKFGYTEEVMEVLAKANTVLREVEISKATLEKISAEFDSNEQLGVLFCIWFCMFPTDGSPNIGWNRLFGIPYKGVTIRIFKSTHASFFKKVARRSDIDMSMFVLGTYLFIRSRIRDGKTFIPKISSFHDDWESWYDKAVEAATDKSAAEVEKLFLLDPSMTATAAEQRDSVVKQVGFIME